MADRPTTHWLRLRAEESAELADCTLSEDDAYLAQSFPDELIDATEDVQTEFEDTIHAAHPTDLPSILNGLKTAVLALNDIQEEFDGAAYETEEREILSNYFDAVLEENGVDLAALAQLAETDVLDLTAPWRTW